MTPAKTVWALLSAIGVAAAAVLALALVAGVGRVSFDAPSAAALAHASRSFTLPDASFASVASLALGSLAVAVLMLAGRSAVRQPRASQAFLRTLIISGTGAGGAAVLFDHPQPHAFCAGLLRPRTTSRPERCAP